MREHTSVKPWCATSLSVMERARSRQLEALEPFEAVPAASAPNLIAWEAMD